MPRNEALTPFLDTDPPHWAARGLAYIVIVLFLTALLACIFVRIPETVSSPFVLVPVRGADPVRTSDDGIVEQVNAVEGSAVRKGDPLFVIQSKVTADRTSEYQTDRVRIKAAEDKLVSAQMKQESQRMADEQEDKRLKGHADYLKRMIDHKKKQLALAKELEENHKKLYEEGITNQAQYAGYQMEGSKISLELEQLETESEQNLTAIQKLRHESEVRVAEFKSLKQAIEEDLNRYKIRRDALGQELAFSSGNLLTIPSPCSGTILRVRTNSAGAVVQEGEILCELACSDDELQAELAVPEIGLVRIKPGQGVKLLYDALPYQRYGVQYGTVRWISPASVAVNNAPAFRVLVDLRDEGIPIQGKMRAFLPGMGGTAQVVVDRRSLISYAFQPIRQLKSMLEKPPEVNDESQSKQSR